MYRTSYTNTFRNVSIKYLLNNYIKKPLPPKNKAIPGY